MAINLEKPAAEVDPFAADYAAVLKNLQANMLKPHGRNFARHIFLKFTDSPGAARWIREEMAPLVTTQWAEYNPPPGDVDAGPVFGFFLSASGFQKLGLPTEMFASEAFRRGMKDQQDGIFDPLLDRDNEDPPPESWEPWFREDIHALVTVADDDPAVAEQQAEAVRNSVAGVASVLRTEEGNVLRRGRAGRPPEAGDPVEHFGYLDGISQPTFTKQDLQKKRAKNREGSQWDPSASLSLILIQDPLVQDPDAFGSYLTYRKLGQDLERFDQTVVAAAQAIGVSADLAGAMVVGRFKDGSPVVLGATASHGPVNDFNFRDADRDGDKCPFHSHIRKVNPRGTTPLTSLERERRRRIARRGIPYGPPIGPHVAEFPASNPDPAIPRGLLFLCFQSQIDEQFEFIQRTWVDNSLFPKGILFQRNTGDDPLIGQDADEAQRWPKKWGDHDAGRKTFNFESAVTLEGGEYFFAPSLVFLRTVQALVDK